MTEVYLSTDGKHTVHVSAETMQELQELLPEAMQVYRRIAAQLGTKPELWGTVMHGGKAKVANGQSNHEAPADDAEGDDAPSNGGERPLCQIHQKPMVLQDGRFGRFWSCRQKNELNQWCSYTQPA